MRTFPRWARRLVSAALVCCCLATAVLRASENTSSYRAALESIRPDELKVHVDYLADDKLEGRLPGTRGGRAAGEYLKKQLEKLIKQVNEKTRLIEQL